MSGPFTDQEGSEMAKDHGPSIKDDKQYEGLRKKGMSKQRAASIANSTNSSSKGGKQSGTGGGGSKSQSAPPAGEAARILDGKERPEEG